MRPVRIGTPLVAVATALALAGCGGGGADDGGDRGPGAVGVTTTAVQASGNEAPRASFRTLANAVCRGEVGAVPPVPRPASPTVAAETRRYLAAVERASGGLARAFVLLERRRPESQETLAPLVTKAKAVARAARASSERSGGAAATADGVEDEVRVAIALLNEASSAAGLPTCAL